MKRTLYEKILLLYDSTTTVKFAKGGSEDRTRKPKAEYIGRNREVPCDTGVRSGGEDRENSSDWRSRTSLGQRQSAVWPKAVSYFTTVKREDGRYARWMCRHCLVFSFVITNLHVYKTF